MSSRPGRLHFVGLSNNMPDRIYRLEEQERNARVGVMNRSRNEFFTQLAERDEVRPRTGTAMRSASARTGRLRRFRRALPDNTGNVESRAYARTFPVQRSAPWETREP